MVRQYIHTYIHEDKYAAKIEMFTLCREVKKKNYFPSHKKYYVPVYRTGAQEGEKKTNVESVSNRIYTAHPRQHVRSVISVHARVDIIYIYNLSFNSRYKRFVREYPKI